MEKRPSASQQIACILWNSSVHHRGRNSLTLVRILSQSRPNQAYSIYFLKKFAVIVLINEADFIASTETLRLFSNPNKYGYTQCIQATG